jgi:hypothetical protein
VKRSGLLPRWIEGLFDALGVKMTPSAKGLTEQ